MKFCIHFHAFYLKETEKCAFNCVKAWNPKHLGRGCFYFWCAKFWIFWFLDIDRVQNRGYRPDPKPPSPARAGTSRGGGCLVQSHRSPMSLLNFKCNAISPVPDVFAKLQLRGFAERIPRRKYSSGEEAGDLRPATWRRDNRRSAHG